MKDISNTYQSSAMGHYDTATTQKLHVDNLKLSEVVEYLRDKLKQAQKTNTKLTEQAAMARALSQSQQKQLESVSCSLRQVCEHRKRLEELLNTSNSNYATLQKKYTACTQELAQMKEKVVELSQKNKDLIQRKKNSHFQCVFKQKSLTQKLESLTAELEDTRQKHQSDKVKLAGLEHKLQNAGNQARKWKKMVQEKDSTYQNLRQKYSRVEQQLTERNSKRQTQISEAIHSELLAIMNQKEAQLIRITKQLRDCESLLEKMAQQVEILLDKNMELESRLMIPTVKLDGQYDKVVEEIKVDIQRVEKLSPSLAQKLLSKISLIQESYQQLQAMYDRLIMKQSMCDSSTSKSS